MLNVGAGAGSYAPVYRHVVAVEPSAATRAQRPPHLAPVFDATAERLPFDAEALTRFWLNEYVPEVLAVEQGVARLRAALESGEWDARHGLLRSQAERRGAVRLVVAH